MRFKTLVLAATAALAFALTGAGCKTRPNTAVPPSPGEKILWKSHDRRPEWVQVQQGESGGFYYTTGLSDRFTTELDSREHAMLKARQSVADYVLGIVETEYRESRRRANGAAAGSDAQVEGQNTIRSTARVAVTQVRPKEWYLEKIRTENGKVLWAAIVLAEAPRDAVQREIARVLRETQTFEERDTTVSAAREKHLIEKPAQAAERAGPQEF